MRKNLTKKLFLSVLTLAFAVISLGASTYAWFTMSEDADVEAFTADVKAGEGIEVAVTSTDSYSSAQWYTGVVPNTVVQAAAVPAGFKFDAVSTQDNAANFVDKNGGTVDGGYISFYVHIKSAEAGIIKLDGISFEGSGSTEWTADAAYDLYEEMKVVVNDKVTYKVENAARVAIIANGTTNIYEKEAVAASGTKSDAGASTYDAGNQVGQNKTKGAYSYYNSKNSTTLDTTVQAKSSYTALTVESLSTPAALKEVSAGDVLTIQVKVWIEGWDAECLNAIFAQTLSVALSFKYV